MAEHSHMSGTEIKYIDSLYHDYKDDASKVDQSWKNFFEGFDYAIQNGDASGSADEGQLKKELQVAALIEGYRSRGHLLADTNPIRERRSRNPYLSLKDFQLSDDDLKTHFAAGSILGLGKSSLKAIVEHLQKLYTGKVGVEYNFIRDKEIREWFQSQYESSFLSERFPIEKKKRILNKLNEAEVFENFLHTKYVGQKRFSLEGGESTIPALDALINRGSKDDVEEVVIGMAHRGRLNVLANIFGKTYEYIFSEFEGDMEPDLTFGDGDVKYHLGFSAQVDAANGQKTYLKLMPNPSHLEAVDPVVLGYARAKIDHVYKEDNRKVLPVLIHGDAALAGQGIVYEVAQMSRLKGYDTGGTIHFVINNQIGFTTDFDDARSSDYSTGVAKAIDVPVIHVNGDDVESVVYAMELAVAFRQKWGRDVYVDMVCYRKHGHNEGDEPKFTQPSLYNLISKHDNPRKVYTDLLISRGDIEAKLAKDMTKNFKKLLQERLNMVKEKPLPYEYQNQDLEWKLLRRAEKEDFEESPDTTVSEDALQKVGEALCKVPDDITPLKKVKRLLDNRKKAFEEGKLDWSLGELCAYGTLLMEEKSIRMSGQDVVRGTFSHRHSIIFDEKSNEGYNNLNHIQEKQAKFSIYNSLLSEYAVLGFEYGYSLARPNGLAIWEAQFGDFANGAQNIIDQFISSGSSKWQKMSGVTLFLPHGYEGQGPEHSNARPERFLQLSAELNMIVANCTTPANFFHIIRRQLAWEFRKPLVVFTPKSIIRHPKNYSTFDEFTKHSFQEVIDDAFIEKPKEVKRVVFCSGKLFYDLDKYRTEKEIKNVAVVRVEQLHPFPEKQIKAIREKYQKAEFIWAQEEPENMGAWTYLLRFEINRDLSVISRKASASPATGFAKIHDKEQNEIIEKAFDLKA